MRIALRSILALAAICCSGTLAHAADIYVLTNDQIFDGSASTNFGRIDTATGTYTSIASLNGDVWNLVWNPSAGNFYVTTSGVGTATLRTLTTGGTLSGSLGTIGRNIYGMALRASNSTMYAYDYDADRTVTMNTSNGALTALNTSPGIATGAPVGGRYSIMNDTIYMTVNNVTPRFGTMGFTAISTFQSTAADALFASMVLANDGTTMYGIFGNGSPGQQRLYTINAVTGAATAGALVSGTGLGTVFHGASIVPEPSTFALGAIATGVMAFVARRRKVHSA